MAAGGVEEGTESSWAFWAPPDDIASSWASEATSWFRALMNAKAHEVRADVALRAEGALRPAVVPEV